jgi:hypothetical protein
MVGMVLAHAGWMFWRMGYVPSWYYESDYRWAPTVMWWVLGVMIFGLAWLVLRGKRGNPVEEG